MPYGDNNDIFGGAMGGAATGAMIGSAVPGIGTAIGAGAGFLVGGLGGSLFGGQKNYGFSKGELQGLWQERQNQIGDFRNELLGYRNQFQSNYQDIQRNTFANFFGPQLITQMAAMGFNPASGGVAQGLATQSSLMQGDFYKALFSAQREDASTVSSMYGQNTGALMGGGMNNYGVPQRQPWLSGLGQLGGAAFGSYLQRQNYGALADAFSKSGGSTMPQFNPLLSQGLFTSASGGRNWLGITPMNGGVPEYGGGTGALGIFKP